MNSNLNYTINLKFNQVRNKKWGQIVHKRDGNKSKFNIHKIFLAVLAALKSSKEGETEQAQNITKIIDDNDLIEIVTVEDIQT